MPQSPVTRRPRAATRAAVLDAAWSLFEEQGLASLTVDAIARRARASKATVYRWWPHKAAVLLDALLDRVEEQIPFPDTGSAREDLRRQLDSVVRLLTGTATGRAYLALVTASHEDPALAEALRERYLATRRELAIEVLRRGVERGELRADLDAGLAVDALYGGLYYRLLVLHAEVDQGYVDRYLAAVFPAFTAS